MWNVVPVVARVFRRGGFSSRLAEILASKEVSYKITDELSV
jgi:hypothetical protein